MVWTAYKVSFELLSPLHMGWRKLGNLQQTRPYLTGRNLWGALTARLTREQGSDKYSEVGEEVCKSLVFSYFYPSTEPEKVGLWPWVDSDEFSWGFLSSYASTALKDGHSKEDGSLHETEFIAPRTRSAEPVYLVGYIFEKVGCSLEWNSALTKLQCGGERNYGWGRLRLYGENPLELVTDAKIFEDYSLNCEGDWPLVTISENSKYLLAHTKAESNNSVESGTLEPLVGLETTPSGKFGQTVSTAEICWTPGSTAKAGATFSIKEKGLWYPV